MQIEDMIKKAEKAATVRKKQFDAIRCWWVENVDLIGRRVAQYRLNDLSNDYNGKIRVDAICIQPSDDPSSASILGYGYAGRALQRGCNIKCATRSEHMRFLRNFPSYLEKHLMEALKIEEEADDAIIDENYGNVIPGIQAWKTIETVRQLKDVLSKAKDEDKIVVDVVLYNEQCPDVVQEKIFHSASATIKDGTVSIYVQAPDDDEWGCPMDDD